jgi:hypothetical protein
MTMMSDDQSTRVMTWWIALSAISIANITAWFFLASGMRRRRALREQILYSTRGWQTLFAALFVGGCAFRSFLPRVEALRFCLYDSWISSATIGRSVATIAELAFVAQWSLVIKEWCRAAGSPLGVLVSRLFLPLIAVAEMFSWYSTLTTNFLGSVFEESLWAATAALVMAILTGLWLRTGDTRQRYLGTILTLNVVYVLFMCTVDVPMYLRRWRADQAAGRRYLTVGQGWRDARSRRIVTHRWVDWREEVPWMSLYFSGGVWLSLTLMRAPRFGDPPSTVSG